MNWLDSLVALFEPHGASQQLGGLQRRFTELVTEKMVKGWPL